MNQEEIQALIENIDRLQISLNRTQGEIDQLRSRFEQERRAGNSRRVDRENQIIEVGDRVRINNGVRLKGSISSSKDIEGNIIRFTKSYVIVNVALKKNKNGVDRYQEIRRAPHNLTRLETVSQ